MAGGTDEAVVMSRLTFEDRGPIDGMSVELVHPCGERKTLPVEGIVETLVTVRWGMSGFYDLNLKSNTLTARSVTAQRRGPCLWVAADIGAVRAMVKAYFDRERERGKAALLRHRLSMPHGTAAVRGPERVGEILDRQGIPRTGNDNGGRGA